MTIAASRIAGRPVPRINAGRCTGCGECVAACPTQALVMRGEVATVSAPERCDYSGRCEAVCPSNAIARPFEVVLGEQ